jgi:hypothetical protein
MTEDERRVLRESFTPSCLLDALNDCDALRAAFNDRDGRRPPEIRETLLRLHALALEVVSRAHEGRAREFFDLAADLDDELTEAAASLERIQRVFAQLADLYPESLLDDEARASA